MNRNTVILRDTDVFMRGELDNVTISDGRIVLDLVQGSYVPYGCYTSAPLPMPAFDALRVSWNADAPDQTAVEVQARVMVDGNWTTWVSFGKWSRFLRRESPAPQDKGCLQRRPDVLLLDSKTGQQAQIRIYLYTKSDRLTPAVSLLCASVRTQDGIPAGGRPVNTRLHLLPYAAARRAPALRPWMDMACSLTALTNRWGADLLPEELAQIVRDWRTDDTDAHNLCFAAAAAAAWGFPTWVCYGNLALLRDEARHGFGAVVALQSTPAEIAAGLPERRFAAVRGFTAVNSTPQVLLCDPCAAENDFDTETAMPLDSFMVAWDNVALLMRPQPNGAHRAPRTRTGAWVRPVGTDFPDIYRLYVNGEEHPLGDDFCAHGGLLAWTEADGTVHASTAHRTFHFTEPQQGGLCIPKQEPPRKCTVFAIDPAGQMLVGDVTV